MRLDDTNNEVLFLGGGILLDFLAELSEFNLWALSDAALLYLVGDGPLAVVLDA